LEEDLGVSMLCFEHKNPSLLGLITAFSNTRSTGKMTSLTAKDKQTVKAFWAKVSGKSEDIGAAAVAR